VSDRGGDGSSAREVASYLVALRPILSSATEARRTWVKRIGVLMEDARKGNAAQVTRSAGSIGHDTAGVFRSGRARLEQMKPPRTCADCHRSLALWLDKLVKACELLIEVGRTGNLARIRETQELLAESRAHAHQFNAEYARLVGDLRQRVAAAARQPQPGRVSRPAPRSAPANG
jgi:hypothetical protein